MKTIVTHSGSFDPDDVMAVAAIQLYCGVDHFQIVRSREKEVIETADWVIDVGGVYDVATNRFDHHQSGILARENGVPYSSFGLVWKEYGEAICDSVAVAKLIEERFVFSIDTADNQITVCQPENPEVLPFEFFDVIETFKPVWGKTETFDEEFMQAVVFGRNLLQRMITQKKGDISMRQMIEAKCEQTTDRSILVFDEPLPRRIFAEYEKVKVVVSPVFYDDAPNWMAAVIPVGDGSFANRALFPEAWAGLMDGELTEVSGITGAVFCHKERYLFVADTRESAQVAAIRAVADIETK